MSELSTTHNPPRTAVRVICALPSTTTGAQLLAPVMHAANVRWPNMGLHLGKSHEVCTDRVITPTQSGAIRTWFQGYVAGWLGRAKAAPERSGQ